MTEARELTTAERRVCNAVGVVDDRLGAARRLAAIELALSLPLGEFGEILDWLATGRHCPSSIVAGLDTIERTVARVQGADAQALADRAVGR